MYFVLDPLVQIAIDESRNILYSRSEKGVIQVSVCVCVYSVCVCMYVSVSLCLCVSAYSVHVLMCMHVCTAVCAVFKIAVDYWQSFPKVFGPFRLFTCSINIILDP